ncbi:MAG TPA: hypothetical protein VI861_03510, partial [Rickettsiales bacterium]|nr:hypothetical protein [Rickettsiales bacterium]
KKLSKFLVVLPLAVLFSCYQDLSKYGKIQSYDPQASGYSSFTFYVDEDYIRDNEKSKIDQKNPQMTKAESKLLMFLLKKNGYCNGKGKPKFVITSKQEKIYDVTFAHLIEQNYRAKPVAPRMYYGKCI